MATKIEGSIHPTEVERITTDGYEDATVYTTPAKGEYVSAVVVIGEKAYTESEVRAMAADMIAVAVSEANTVYPSEQHAEKGVIHAMRETIERHGVSLDPA